MLLCYEDEGVYVNTFGRIIKDVVLQWGEMPTSVGEPGRGGCLGQSPERGGGPAEKPSTNALDRQEGLRGHVHPGDFVKDLALRPAPRAQEHNRGAWHSFCPSLPHAPPFLTPGSIHLSPPHPPHHPVAEFFHPIGSPDFPQMQPRRLPHSAESLPGPMVEVP